jgi:orotidine-5'-phosphate decarboxylase
MDMLQTKWDEGKFVCVGLDPDYSKIPDLLKAKVSGSNHKSHKAEVITNFCQSIVDATHDYVLAYKPNSAFFERYGWEGMLALENVIAYIKHKYPDVPVILDAKRGDIGNTNDGYVEAAFEIMNADAITVHGYMGQESLKPFLDRADKGVIVLCRTSNPGAGEFQNFLSEFVSHGVRESEPLYQSVAHRVSNFWNDNANCAVVVGATAPEELAEVRRIVGDMPILLPGIGAQGGDLEKTVLAGINSKGDGIIVNLSRSVLYASAEDNFADAAVAEVIKINDAIRELIATTKGV